MVLFNKILRYLFETGIYCIVSVENDIINNLHKNDKLNNTNENDIYFFAFQMTVSIRSTTRIRTTLVLSF